MSEETAKFKVYVSYLEDEAPTELIDDLVKRLPAEFGADSVIVSSPETESWKSVRECPVLLHVLTTHSLRDPHCQKELSSIAGSDWIAIALQVDNVNANRALFNVVLEITPNDLPHYTSLFGLIHAVGAVYRWVERDETLGSPLSQLFLLADAFKVIDGYEFVKRKMSPPFAGTLRHRINLANNELATETAAYLEQHPTDSEPVAHQRLLSLLRWLRGFDLPGFDSLVTTSKLSALIEPSEKYFWGSARAFGQGLLPESGQASDIRERSPQRTPGSPLSRPSPRRRGGAQPPSKDSPQILLSLENLESLDLDEIRQRLVVLEQIYEQFQDEDPHNGLRQPILTLMETIRSFIQQKTTELASPTVAVGFTLYSPSQTMRNTPYSLVVYAHKPEQQKDIKQDARKFSDELGNAPKERHSADAIPLAPKTEITIIPEAEGIFFNPPQLTKTWDKRWLRFNFDFEVPETYSDEEVLLRISVQVKGFEVACIKSSCEVVAESAAETVSALPDDPLVDPPRESGTRKADAHLYRNVFLSYSHKDEEIAWRRARQIEQALGDRVFMDVKDLRAGDDWETRLFEWIDQADIIHLLWSENSAHSDYCRKEWTYALEKKCGDTRCFGVIRPVYWQKPMPEPPPELAHLHFQPIKLEGE